MPRPVDGSGDSLPISVTADDLGAQHRHRAAIRSVASALMSFSSVLAALPATLPAAVVRDRTRLILAVGAEEQLESRIGDPPDERDPFSALNALRHGWWAGFASYDLGRRVERVETNRTVSPTDMPDLSFIRFGARVELAVDGTLTRHGSGPARAALDRAIDAPAAVAAPAPSAAWSTSLDRLAYERGVRIIQALIRAGHCYQVNLARQLTGPVVDPVALHGAVASGNPAPYGTFWRDGRGLAIVSASPERFLRIDGRAVETRPIKGTAVRAARLRASEKDRAENVMIVDLARNDLGRVCVPGSIAVPELCSIEPHPGLVHLVSTVRGELRADVGLGELLQATFPPASITGAPKPRVMQAIEDLEPVRRGVYCGALGWIDADRGRADLAVAIRTFTCTPAATTFGVGAGITIDSDPASEWAETELKAARLLRLAGVEPPVPASASTPAQVHGAVS